MPNLAELAAGYYTLPTGFGLDTNYSVHLWARAAGVGVQIAFGTILLFAASRIVRASFEVGGQGAG